MKIYKHNPQTWSIALGTYNNGSWGNTNGDFYASLPENIKIKNGIPLTIPTDPQELIEFNRKVEKLFNSKAQQVIDGILRDKFANINEAVNFDWLFDFTQNALRKTVYHTIQGSIINHWQEITVASSFNTNALSINNDLTNWIISSQQRKTAAWNALQESKIDKYRIVGDNAKGKFILRDGNQNIENIIEWDNIVLNKKLGEFPSVLDGVHYLTDKSITPELYDYMIVNDNSGYGLQVYRWNGKDYATVANWEKQSGETINGKKYFAFDNILIASTEVLINFNTRIGPNGETYFIPFRNVIVEQTTKSNSIILVDKEAIVKFIKNSIATSHQPIVGILRADSIVDVQTTITTFNGGSAITIENKDGDDASYSQTDAKIGDILYASSTEDFWDDNYFRIEQFIFNGQELEPLTFNNFDLAIFNAAIEDINKNEIAIENLKNENIRLTNLTKTHTEEIANMYTIQQIDASQKVQDDNIKNIDVRTLQMDADLAAAILGSIEIKNNITANANKISINATNINNKIPDYRIPREVASTKPFIQVVKGDSEFGYWCYEKCANDDNECNTRLTQQLLSMEFSLNISTLSKNLKARLVMNDIGNNILFLDGIISETNRYIGFSSNGTIIAQNGCDEYIQSNNIFDWNKFYKEVGYLKYDINAGNEYE